MTDSGAFCVEKSWVRTGHFVMASGHHGIRWLDLELLFARPARLQPSIVDLGSRLERHGLDAVCGPLSGGAFLAYAIAQAFGWEFFFTERCVAADGSSSYALPASLVPRMAGKRTAIVDDAINAGSAVRATHADLVRHGASCVAIGSLIALGSSPATIAEEMHLPLETLVRLPNDLWMPADCPICERGVPLDN